MVIFPFCIHSAKFKKLINCVIKTVEIVLEMYYQKVGSKILFTETSKKIPRV